MNRVHVTYTLFRVAPDVVSTVMYDLSWKTFGVVPSTRTAVPQVRPPSVDFVTAKTLSLAVRLNPRQVTYPFPSASNATLGSPETVTCVRGPFLGTTCSIHVRPLSNVE